MTTLLQGGTFDSKEMELAKLLVIKGVDGQGVPAKGSELSEQNILKKVNQQIVLKKDNQEKEKENIKQELKTQLISFRAVSVKYDHVENKTNDDDHLDPDYSPPNELKARYPCEQCGKCFKSPKWVENHYKSHLKTEEEIKDQRIECLSCSKTFSNKYILKAHMKSHTSNPATGDRALCNICSKTFANKYILKAHIGSHSKDTEAEGENHLCHVCQKTFSNKYNLKYHIRTHDEHGQENETTLCNICSKILKRAVLKKHMRNMHGETKTAECRYCGLETRMSSINAHENRCKRSDEEKLLRKVKCGQCDKALSSRNKLRRHMKNIHGQLI